MILSGSKILEEVRRGRIEIEPFEESHVNPASVDLCLGENILTMGTVPGGEWDPAFDVKVPQHCLAGWIGSEGYVIRPGHLYLMHTRERIYTADYVPVLDGKSSIGRLGIVVHLTAGYGDPGFAGQYTLEVTTIYPIRIYAGMRFCQMRFHTMLQPGDTRTAGYDGHWHGDPPSSAPDYQKVGHYTGEQRGPMPSLAYKQFERK